MKKPSVWSLLKPYKFLVACLLLCAFASNGLNLLLPKVVQEGIDGIGKADFDLNIIIWKCAIYSIIIFVFTYGQGILQTYVAEKVAKELRDDLIYKLSIQSYAFIQQQNPNKLLTNLTSDIEAIKNFVSQAVVAIISSVVLIFGAAGFLIQINWKLGLMVLCVIPIIAISFVVIIKKVKGFHKEAQANIDRLNQIINQSIIGSMLLRVLNAQYQMQDEFLVANTKTKTIGLSILRMFAMLIPIIVFTSNLAKLVVLYQGGSFVINGSMTLGELAAFNNYIAILIFPIMVIGFMSNMIARASASYGRIASVLHASEVKDAGTFSTAIQGNIEVKDLSYSINNQQILKNISFKVVPGSKNAIIGPTAAGKTQLLYHLIGLIKSENQIYIEGSDIHDWDKTALLSQIGIVFQDSIVFNQSFVENIAFNQSIDPSIIDKAIYTACLDELVKQLPEGINTIISERGNTLSGGQKQRLMLARALAIQPKVLFLDDFTARVDRKTELEIWKRLATNFPDITIVSITQNIEPIADYDQIILIMEGEIVIKGKHHELMQQSTEYLQIYQSQQSTNEL